MIHTCNTPSLHLRSVLEKMYHRKKKQKQEPTERGKQFWNADLWKLEQEIWKQICHINTHLSTLNIIVPYTMWTPCSNKKIWQIKKKHTNNIDASKNSSYETVKQFSYWPLQMERFSKHTFNYYHIYLHLPTWLLLQVWCHGKTEQVLKQNWHLQDRTSALSFLNADVCCIPNPTFQFSCFTENTKACLQDDFFPTVNPAVSIW